MYTFAHIAPKKTGNHHKELMTEVTQVRVEGSAVQMGWDWDPKIALSIRFYNF